jgi:hypothetical protein
MFRHPVPYGAVSGSTLEFIDAYKAKKTEADRFGTALDVRHSDIQFHLILLYRKMN